MNINLPGRVKNITLPTTRCLLPLHEAIVNSLQAIEDLGSPSNPRVEIKVIREKQTTESLFGEKELPPISAFEIKDTGVGFNSENFDSFETSDTNHKHDRGGKGIGRFLWLKAFDYVEVTSAYQEGNKYARRAFRFSLEIPKGIAPLETENLPTPSFRETTVRLLGFKDDYKKFCPKRLATIADRIIEHCLSYFVSGTCPSISITDGTDTISLNDRFNETLKSSAVQHELTVGAEKLKLICVKLFSGEEVSHRLHFCANRREVCSENLASSIPNLVRKLQEPDGTSFFYLGFVFGDILDKYTNQERTDFVFPEEKVGQDSLLGASYTEIKRACISTIKTKLDFYLKPIQAEKLDTIKRHIDFKSPQYKPILKYSEAVLEDVPPGLSEEKLESALHEVRFKLEKEVRERSQKYLSSIDTGTLTEEDERTYQDLLAKVNELGKSTLAQYVLQRRTVLELFERRLKKRGSGSFELEKAIHELIFPLKAGPLSVEFDKQNLWMIDERLAYHSYVASDLPLSADSKESQDRPDLIIFDMPVAFSGDQQGPQQSIVIVEFKRPGREDFLHKGKDPVTQVYNYVRELKKGEVRGHDGRPIVVNESTNFYGYVLCDFVPATREMAENNSLQESADKQRFYGYNVPLKTFVEVISYDKLASDAMKRNKIFFDKLQLL